MNDSRVLALAGVGVMVVALASCGGGGAGGGGAAPEGGQRETIAFFTKNQTNPYFQAVRLGADNAAKQMNATVVHYAPTKPDSIPEQMSQIEDVIVKRPDAVAFTPVDFKAMVPGVQKLNAANIPVVNMTDRIAGAQHVTFVGCDDPAIAENTARYLLTRLNGRGNVIILEGVGGSANNTMRVRGFQDALAQFPDVTLLASQPANFQRLLALQVTENLLQSYPRIDGILAANDAMALGAVEALAAANRKALVIGLNGTKEAVDAIKAGALLASGDCDGFKQGCLGTMAAVRHLRRLPVPAQVELPVVVFDATNFADGDVPYDRRSCPTWDSVMSAIADAGT